MNKKVYQTLRILSSIVAALILAAAVFIFIYLGWMWGLISLAVAGIFVALTFFFKGKQEALEKKDEPKRGDFITGSSKNDDKRS